MNNNQTNGSSLPLQFALVGTGSWALNGNFLHIIKGGNNQHLAEIVAIVEPNERRRGNALNIFKGADGYETVEDLLSSNNKVSTNLNGIFITSPHVTHYSLAKLALEKGMNVMIEKPMVTNVDHGYELIKLAKEKNVLFWVNNTANFRPQSIKAFNAVKSGDLGNIEHVQCHMAGALRGLMSGELGRQSASTWAQPDRSGGYGWGQLCHLLAWVFKVSMLTPSEVFCFQNNGPSGVDLTSAAVVKCTNGATISISGAATLPSHTEDRGKQINCRIFGSKGSISYCGRDEDLNSGKLEIDLMKNGNTVYASETFAFEECTHPPNTNEKSWSRLDAKFPDVMTEWVNACNGRDYFDGAPGEIGQRVVLVLHAMYESAKEGKLIKVDNRFY